MDNSPTYCAVVMGDLVKSESSLAPERLYHHFNQQVDAVNMNHARHLTSPLTITLGDEFQGLVRSLTAGATIARTLRMALLADHIDCRFVIGLAAIKTPINPDRAWNMMGPGLARARAKLNEKSGSTHYRFSLPQTPMIETLLDAIGAGLTAIEQGWTDRQRDDISAALDLISAKDLAKRRNVSVHNIYKIRSSGKFDAYRLQWQAVLQALTALDHNNGLDQEKGVP